MPSAEAHAYGTAKGGDAVQKRAAIVWCTQRSSGLAPA